MAVTNTAAFGQTPFFAQALVVAAKAHIGTATNTNAVSMGAVGANGTIITGLGAITNNAVTAVWCAVYYSTDSGTTLRVFAIGLMATWTEAATTSPTPLALNHMDGSPISPLNPVYIPYSATTLLYAAAGVAVTDGIVFTANGVSL